MGLFDFVGDIGKKIFSKEEEASAAVTNHINEDNPGVADVAVKVENGVAKISGVASSAGALEKAVLMAGNIAGISNERGNVVGLMPHPEHAVEPGFGPSSSGFGDVSLRGGADGLGVFTSVLSNLINAR